MRIRRPQEHPALLDRLSQHKQECIQGKGGLVILPHACIS